MSKKINKRKQFREILIKSGRLVSCIPFGMHQSDPGKWTERAMRTAALYRSCSKIMSHKSAIGYIQQTVYERRGVELTYECISELIQTGIETRFIRSWKWLIHMHMKDMVAHANTSLVYSEMSLADTAELINIDIHYA